MKLHLGCGQTVMKDWINIDKYVKFNNVHQIPIENLPYENESVSIIYTSHMIEHILPDLRDKALKEWYRVLKKDGKLVIRCPYAPYYLNEWLNWSPKERLQIHNILGMQTEGEGMYNHGLYCNESLKILLESFKYNVLISKIITPRNPDLVENKIKKGILDPGEDVPGLPKRDIYCVATK